MNQLIKASDLALPRISGTVSVNLEELDRLRSEHATAVKLAQELESKQALVKIVVGEDKYTAGSYTYDSKGREKYIQGTNQFVQQSVEYKGFEEFRESIRIEEYSKIEKDMKTLRAESDKYRNACQEHANNYSLFKNKCEETEKKLKEAEANLVEMTKEVEDRNSTIKNLIETNQSLFLKENETFSKLRDLEKRKVTLGYWIKTKFDNIFK